MKIETVKHLNQIKHSGFKTPKGYFKDFEIDILSEIKLHEKVKDSGFNMPENYLESLEKKVLKKSTATPKVTFLHRNSIYAISSVAAAILVLVFLNVTQPTITLDVVENDAIENYIREEFESVELVSLIENSVLSESDFINYHLSNSTIESIIENDDELELYFD